MKTYIKESLAAGLTLTILHTILIIVDCFSKAVHFVPLYKLPSALETSTLLVQHVFRLHGIPQFASQV